MPERVLNMPLSGEEVRTAILEKLSRQLERDCFLSANAAYDYFSAKVRVEISLHDVGRDAKVDSTIVEQRGDAPEGEVKVVETEQEIAVAPPNEVRVETGQEVPVLTTKEGKPEIKGIKYARTRVKK